MLFQLNWFDIISTKDNLNIAKTFDNLNYFLLFRGDLL